MYSPETPIVLLKGFHIYADNTPIYEEFDLYDLSSSLKTLLTLQEWINEIRTLKRYLQHIHAYEQKCNVGSDKNGCMNE